MVRGQISFSDTIRAYNKERIVTNAKGMAALTTWGFANMVAGGTGFAVASQDEWRYFHEMNAIWGAVNTGIGVAGYLRACKEIRIKTDAEKAYKAYRRDKTIYLVNIGLDVVYAGIGAGLVQYAKGDTKNPDMYRGFGKSLAIQGAALFIFDNIMFAAHNRSSGKWFTIMEEIRFTGNGIGFTHTFR